jgi:hypothetical protein
MNQLMVSFEQNDVHHCPLCYKQHDDASPKDDVLKHVKRCYLLRAIKTNIKDTSKLKTTTKTQIMSDTIDTIEREMTDYWLSLIDTD